MAQRTNRRAAAGATAATVGTVAAVGAERRSQAMNDYGEIITRSGFYWFVALSDGEPATTFPKNALEADDFSSRRWAVKAANRRNA